MERDCRAGRGNGCSGGTGKHGEKCPPKDLPKVFGENGSGCPGDCSGDYPQKGLAGAGRFGQGASLPGDARTRHTRSHVGSGLTSAKLACSGSRGKGSSAARESERCFPKKNTSRPGFRTSETGHSRPAGRVRSLLLSLESIAERGQAAASTSEFPP